MLGRLGAAVKGVGGLAKNVAGAALGEARTALTAVPNDEVEVENLLQRISGSLMPEYRRQAMSQLKDLLMDNPKAQMAFGSMGVPILMAVLRDDRDDVALLQSTLESLVAATSGGGHGGHDGLRADHPHHDWGFCPASCGCLARVSAHRTPVGVSDFYVRYHTVQLLTALLNHCPTKLQEAILATPMSVAKLLAGGTLEALLGAALQDGGLGSPPVRAAAMGALGDLVAGNAPAQERLAKSVAAFGQELVAALVSSSAAMTAAAQPGSAASAAANAAMNSSSSSGVPGVPPDLLMPRVVRTLTGALRAPCGDAARVVVCSLLRLLLVWLADCPPATSALLDGAAHEAVRGRTMEVFSRPTGHKPGGAQDGLPSTPAEVPGPDDSSRLGWAVAALGRLAREVEVMGARLGQAEADAAAAREAAAAAHLAASKAEADLADLSGAYNNLEASGVLHGEGKEDRGEE
eukprot:XP_001696482.1 predicted protein [Chlamydomonas reinhardtii]